ncbi:hypothetical protein GCM10009848_20680 [Micromonospora lupini]
MSQGRVVLGGGVVGGGVVGGGVVGGGVVGGGVVGGGVVDGGVVGFTTPVQVVPFRAKEAGAGLLPVQLPLKPKLVLPLVGMPAL